MKQLAFGVDIGGINSAFGLVDNRGHIYAESVVPTSAYPHFGHYAEYVERLAAEMKQMLDGLDFEYELMGIGIGAPNATYHKGRIEQPANLWKFPDAESGDESQRIFELVADLRSYFPDCQHIYITNDANAATIGEMMFGAARGMRDFVVVTLGTGLGSGFVAGGQMIYGHDGFAGELGHVVVERGGRECGCGRKGCLECYVSATGMRRTAFDLMSSMRVDSPLRSVPYNSIDSLQIARAAQGGDPLALEAFRVTGEMLGRALADVVVLTSPEAIILFGGMAKAGRLIFEPTQRYMEENMMPNFRGKVKLLPSGVSDGNIAIMGAAALVWQSLDSSKSR
ncbi:MAG: ROK family protein [Rikenellaceae bacterium]